jgi:hypothetical protein
MIHPCEPSLEKLKALRQSLLTEEPRDDRKIKAIEEQIGRHEAVKKAAEDEAKAIAAADEAAKERLEAAAKERSEPKRPGRHQERKQHRHK